MLLCEICENKFSQITSYNNHQRVHKFMKNARYICKFKNCGLHFRNFKSFESHVTRRHSILEENIVDYFTCTIYQCTFQHWLPKQIVIHLGHHIKNGEPVSCFILNCNYTKKFTKHATLRSHLYRSHPNWQYKQMMEKSSDMSTAEIMNDTCSLNNFDTETNKNFDFNNSQNINLQALLYLKLECKHFLSENVINILVNEMKDLHVELNNIQYEVLNSHLQNTNCGENLILDVLSTLKTNHLFFLSPYNVFHTKHLRHKFYKMHFRYVEPTTITLGRNSQNKLCTFQYVSIYSTISNLLQDKTVQNQIFSETSTTEGVFKDFKDGYLFKNNSLYEIEPQALQILLYQDCFEVCNPLGSSKTKYKILGVYFIIANLLPHNKSKIDNIQLAILCTEKNFKYFGSEKIFSPLINDLKKIELEGILVTYNNEIKKCFGTVIAVAGDNLGSHCLGGFCENFSTSEYICRYCYFQRSNLSKNIYGSKLRSPSNYKTDVSKISDDVQNINGIKFDSVFNSLNYYHVASPGLPPCLAHDLFEGIVQYDFMLIIKKIVKKKYISFRLLNKKIRNFVLDIHNIHTSLPAVNENSKKINGQALETCRLLQSFAIIMLGSINTEDEIWQMYLCLKQFCDLVCAPVISYNQTLFMDILWKKYLIYRNKYLPIPLRPKHHYLTHYGDLTRKFGPLIRCWTMRFENKHQYFKKIIKHLPNFINVTKSLAEKHQLLQASFTNCNLFDDYVVLKKHTNFNINTVPNNIKPCLLQLCSNHPQLLVTYYAGFKGKIYKEDMVVVAQRDVNENLSVVKIKFLLTTKSKDVLYFIGDFLKCIYIDFLGLYEISYNTEEYICLNHSDLLDYDPLIIYPYEDKCYLLPKHAFLDRF